MSVLLPQRELDQDTFCALLGLVHRHTGITMNESKKTLLEGRLRPRMRSLSITSFAEYVRYLERHHDEVQNFINMVTTNQTSFFRTAKIWDYVEREFLPEWQARNSGKVLRIWSAAASSGEEAYSTSMICQDFRQRNPGFEYSILATDISTKALAKAEEGIYRDDALSDVRVRNPLYERYFQKASLGWKITNTIREPVHFGKHSLFDSPPRTRYFDIVFLRNVMIYFEAKDQEKVLANVSNSLREGGMLVIGESESLSRLKTDFRFAAPMLYTRNEALA